MKIKSMLAATALSFTSVATLLFIGRYARWKRAALQRLQGNSQVIDTPLGAVEYSIKGKGPAVLFIHGSPGGYDQGMAVAELLEDNAFTRIAVSRPGYLRTPMHQKTPEAQADLYAALLDKLGLQTAAIVGVSGGGPSALQFALRHSARCSALVLLCALSRSFSEREILDVMPPLQRFIKPRIENLVYFNNPVLFVLEGLNRRQPSPTPIAFLHSLEMHQLRDVGYKNDMRLFEHLADYPLENITAPTLVAQGDSDNNLPLKHSQMVASKIPHARYIIDEGGNHFFFIEHKDKIMPIIGEFLRENAQVTPL